MAASTTTKHTPECCPPGRGPGFRRTPGCPRCEELTAGAEARRPDYAAEFGRRARVDAERTAEIKAHFAANSPHDRGECGRNCTFGEW
jgi:hypothetical protein